MSKFEKRVNDLIARVLHKVRNRTAPTSKLHPTFTSLKNNTAPFINFPSSIAESVVQYRNDHVFTDTTTWAGVKCRLFQLGPFQIKTLCKNVNRGISFPFTNPRKYKVFVKLGRYRLRHMGDYSKLIRRGVITERMHRVLQQFLRDYTIFLSRELGKPLILLNHNTDVPILHFKFKEYAAS